ncbi:superinfection immunity protein [Frankia sp. Cr2]|uniref:superinfection immunity protein n=1 Tax=Frankia sp. Cr2 TaxID=3073932 RepID=UPI002AD3FB83|nr:superinfection immunity protein [Frankia sp. Cr2]
MNTGETMDVAAADGGSGAVAGIAILLLIIGSTAFYFIPTIIAVVRKRQVASVLVINLFLGWTLVGWVVAIALAVSNSGTPVQVNVNQAGYIPPGGYPPAGYPPQGGWQDPNAYPPAQQQQQLPPGGWQTPQAGWQQQQQPWSTDPGEQNSPR